MMTENQRTEYISRCRQRAMDMLEETGTRPAIRMLLADMQRYPETKLSSLVSRIGVEAAAANDANLAREFIEGV